MKKLLITGSNGQLGRALQKLCPPDIQIIPTDFKELDITDKEACVNKVLEEKPSHIINAAAYTNVEQAEDDKDLALKINKDGAYNLAYAANKANCGFVHISTDFVFNGETNKPYIPSDKPAPLSVYGYTKFLGEQAIINELGNKALIIRTAWLYSKDGKNFVNTILNLLKARSLLKIINNQHGTPTSADSLAKAIFVSIEKNVTGIHHFTDGGEATWYEFACEIQRMALKHGLIREERQILPIMDTDFPTKAKRPHYGVLDKTSFIEATGIVLEPWQDVLDRTFA